jgi:signal transduction histidine kinase
VSESLRLPDLLLVSEGRRIGSPTFRTDGATRIPLTFGAHPVGELWARPRRGQSELDSSDIAALELIAVPIAAAVHAMGLSEQLQQSRRQLVDAQAEERRRLHRDLHDGLGPALTAIALRADAAGNVSLTDPTKSRSLITELADQTRQAINEVRRIAHDLGPQSLEHLSLVQAINRQAAAFTSRLGGGTLIVSTDLPDVLPAIPVDVRDAAFRIVTEALNNIARHSNATAAVIRIQHGPTLVLEVYDNGTSKTGSWDQGFGLTSMRERAVRTGATFRAGPTPGGGRIHAEFPLPIAASTG